MLHSEVPLRQADKSESGRQIWVAVFINQTLLGTHIRPQTTQRVIWVSCKHCLDENQDKVLGVCSACPCPWLVVLVCGPDRLDRLQLRQPPWSAQGPCTIWPYTTHRSFSSVTTGTAPRFKHLRETDVVADARITGWGWGVGFGVGGDVAD